MTDPAPPDTLRDDLQRCRKRFQALVEPHRPDLYRHCRWLTGDPWDAEDLVQDTVLRAFASLSRRFADLPPIRPWLLRIATNRWIDLRRADREGAPALAEPVAPAAVDPVEFGEAAEILLALPPRERAVVALVDGLGLSAADAAACLDSGEGAVRAALHRGRDRLRAAAPVERRRLPAKRVDAGLLAAFVSAFNARDLPALRAVLAPHCRAEVIGLVHEETRDEIMGGSIAHTVTEVGCTVLAETVVIDGETMVLFTYPDDGADTRSVGDVLRFTTSDGAISEFRYYFFCPEVLREIGARLGRTVTTSGYWFR
ncbi:MAG TPA: RNA polymerase sigma factor [Planctomycetota bacterium]|nr:RNA polymerase sigma factor [Planctomycetota bacterium]